MPQRLSSQALQVSCAGSAKAMWLRAKRWFRRPRLRVRATGPLR